MASDRDAKFNHMMYDQWIRSRLLLKRQFPKEQVCPAAGQGQEGKYQGGEGPGEQRQLGKGLQCSFCGQGRGRRGDLSLSSVNDSGLCATGVVVSGWQVSDVLGGRSLMLEICGGYPSSHSSYLPTIILSFLKCTG